MKAQKIPKVAAARRRTPSESSLAPKDELLRDSIRESINSHNFMLFNNQWFWSQATVLAGQFSKRPEIIRKAMYNHKSFIMKKVEKALIENKVTDDSSPLISDICDNLQVRLVNVLHVLQLKRDEICKMISLKDQQLHQQ